MRMLTEKIRSDSRSVSRGTYGAPRVHAALRNECVRVGKKRVARLMKAAGLRGVSRRKRPSTTIRAEGARPAPDLVERNFSAERPDELWVADITLPRNFWVCQLGLASCILRSCGCA